MFAGSTPLAVDEGFVRVFVEGLDDREAGATSIGMSHQAQCFRMKESIPREA